MNYIVSEVYEACRDVGAPRKRPKPALRRVAKSEGHEDNHHTEKLALDV